MMLAIQALRTILAAAGIIVRAVRFDSNSRVIVVDFTLAGQARTKIIPFSEIEDLFSQAPARPPGPPLMDETDGGGIPPPP